MMMNATTGAVLLLVTTCLGAATASAQEGSVSVGQIRVTEPTSGLEPVILGYGFGPAYTDGTDNADIEVPPFPPPGDSFGAWFNRTCDDPDFEGEPCYWKTDYRGIPDSVDGEERSRFSLFFDIGIHNNTGQPLTLAVLNPDYPRYADSIVLTDVTGRGFQKTLTGPEVFELPNEFISRILMTVYFDLNQSSVNAPRLLETERLDAYPNPVVGSSCVLRGDFRRGDVLVLLNSSGEELSRSVSAVSAEELSIDLPATAAGPIMVQWRTSTGMLRGWTMVTQL